MKIYPIWNYLFAVHKQSRGYLQYICESYTESYSNLIRVGPVYVKYTHYTWFGVLLEHSATQGNSGIWFHCLILKHRCAYIFNTCDCTQLYDTVNKRISTHLEKIQSSVEPISGAIPSTPIGSILTAKCYWACSTKSDLWDSTYSFTRKCNSK